jgi:hypothetical protein
MCVHQIFQMHRLFFSFFLPCFLDDSPLDLGTSFTEALTFRLDPRSLKRSATYTTTRNRTDNKQRRRQMEGGHEEVYRRAAKAIKEGTFLLVGAGAGMSADSGLPGTHTTSPSLAQLPMTDASLVVCGVCVVCVVLCHCSLW